MPVIHRQRLAARLRQNWSAMYPPETQSTFQVVDDSLTSLAWLQNLNVMRLAANSSSSSLSRFASSQPSTPTTTNSSSWTTTTLGNYGSEPSSIARRSYSLDHFPPPPHHPHHPQQQQQQLMELQRLAFLQVDPNDILDMSNNVRGGGGGGFAGKPSSNPAATADEAASAVSQLEKDRFKFDPSVKPPFSYATLICMAMQEALDRRITLSQIYTWIADNYAYYRQADQNWQHSIRHNLSLNKCFQKVPRGKDEPGKGGFWTINPDFYNLVDRGIIKKKRNSGDAFLNNGGGGGQQATGKKDTSTDRNQDGRPPSGPAVSKKIEDGRTLTGYPAGASTVEVVGRICDPILHFGADSLTDALDMSWSNILNEDIVIGGMNIKTEDILDQTIASTLESPPPSDTESSSDLELDALLNLSVCPPPMMSSGQLSPVGGGPRLNGNPLDLTIHGVGLQPPNWWNESINGCFLQTSGVMLHDQNGSGMHTPAIDAAFDENYHPWAEHREDILALAAFDACLLDTDNLENDSFKLF